VVTLEVQQMSDNRPNDSERDTLMSEEGDGAKILGVRRPVFLGGLVGNDSDFAAADSIVLSDRRFPVSTSTPEKVDPNFSSDTDEKLLDAQLEDILVQLRLKDIKIEQDQADIKALKLENQAALADLKVVVERYVGQAG
jgi:hypothetical protein